MSGDLFILSETIIAEILKPIISSQSTVNISAEQIARLMTGAIYGFKNSATNVEELRQLYNDLITIILVSLESQKSQSKKSK
ncbi:MAG: hypothetical protein ABI686_09960 [Acidobacteriota bacterium]